MTTFLWMLYLALTIFLSINTIISSINVIKNQKINSIQIYNQILGCILWSIWYFYYLH